jgi:hypothetical protein
MQKPTEKFSPSHDWHILPQITVSVFPQLLVGLGGLGIEIAKDLALAGIKYVPKMQAILSDDVIISYEFHVR